jgi:antitoxin (DNA-binding transcriptional repressor) of toxin-antitoxin stability system
MKTVGIRELKTNLSQVLREVAAGDVYLVTDRGRVVAELRQPEVGGPTGSAEQRALARLAAMGQLRVAERPPRPYVRSPVTARKGLAKSLLDTDRGE